MAVKSEVVDSERVIDVDFDVKNWSPQELVSYLKFSFRESDFAKAESILMAREAKLKLEIETAQKANECLTERLEREGMEKHRVQEEFTQEKIIVYERLRKAENEAESWRNKYMLLESRISNLEADSKLLLNVDCSKPDVRVSGENAKDVKLEMRKANVDRDCYGGQEPPSRRVVEIIDSDDDCSPGAISSKNEMTSPRVPSSAHSGQTGGQSGTGMLKRKLDACLSVSENKIDNNVDDVEVNNSATADCKTEKLQKLTHEHDGSGQTVVQSGTGMLKRKLDACLSVSENKIYNNVVDVEVNSSATADCNTEKLQMLTHEHDGSPVRHSTVAIPPSGNNVEKLCTSSSQRLVNLRQCEEKMEREHTSQNLKRESLSGFPAAFDIEDSSSSSSSSSDSDDDLDMDFDFSQLIGTQNDKKWESEADMLAGFVKDNKLYLEAVCALYRQQTKTPQSSSSTKKRGFSHSNAHRGTTLAEFLIDGDLQGKLRKSIPELQQYDEKGLDDCKKLAIEHFKQLFEIYQSKEDPLFFS